MFDRSGRPFHTRLPLISACACPSRAFGRVLCFIVLCVGDSKAPPVLYLLYVQSGF